MAEAKNKREKDSENKQRPQVLADSKNSYNWPARTFWGLLLLTLGVLLLLDNFALVEVQLENLWRLWPLIIVALGFSILSLPGQKGRVISWLLIALTLIAVVVVSVVPLEVTETDQVSQIAIEQSEEIDLLQLSYSGGAGTIAIDSTSEGPLVDATLDSNFASLEEESSFDSGVQTVNLSIDGSNRWWSGGWRNELTLTISEQLPVELRLDTGAARLSADLSRLDLRRFDINTGASSNDIKLGERGEMTVVNVGAGASSIDLRVAKNSGLRLEMDSSVGSLSLSDLEEIEEGIYQSSNYDTAGHRVMIGGSLGAASFKLHRY